MSLNIAQQFMKEMVKIYWSIKNAGESLNKLKSRGFLASGLSTYDFSTLYTTLPHNLIKEKLAGPRSAVGNVSGYRCVSDCRSRGREFDPGPAPYFRGD